LFSVFIVECSYPTDFYDQQLDGIVRLPLPSVTEAPFDNAFPREAPFDANDPFQRWTLAHDRFVRLRRSNN
jgi:hypothetical protein